MSDLLTSPQRVLIASSHSLFGKGLMSLLADRWREKIEIVGLVSNIDEAMDALATLSPSLLIVDYDDTHLNRDDFLGQFIKGTSEVRIVMLSLKDGEEGAEAIVYDRKTLSASKIEDWLEIDSTGSTTGRGDNE